MKTGAIVLAAGQGSRFGARKQDLKVLDETLWEMVTRKASEVVNRDNIIVVGVDVEGGNTRSESVKIGIEKLAPDTDRVIILESARPLVTVEQISRLLNDDSESSTYFIDLVDTVISKSGKYLNRKDHCNLQTPQAFNYRLLKQAYESNEFLDMTDETRVMFEHHLIKPSLLNGGINLMKVTYENDYHTLLNMLKYREFL
jgi:2-C-methyl-D-erythritol 4-phosphate cytidylyltransferase